MAYYLQGDYYQGDPFLGGLLKTVGRGISGAVGGFLGGGPIGAITGGVRAISGATFTRRTPQPTSLRTPVGAPVPRVSIGQRFRTAGQAMIPGGVEPFAAPPKKKYRRMNVTNDKALRRAVRRQQGFVKLAKKALQGTGYTVVSRSSRARKVNVRESGAGSVTVH